METVASYARRQRDWRKREWLRKNPFGQFLVTKPESAKCWEGLKSWPAGKWKYKLCAVWRVGLSYQDGACSDHQFGNFGDGRAYNYHCQPGLSIYYKVYNDWEKFKRDYPDLAAKLVKENPACGKRLKKGK